MQAKPASGFRLQHPRCVCYYDLYGRQEMFIGAHCRGGALDAPHVRLSKMGEIVYRHIISGNHIPGICVDRFVIMPNHIHLILRVDGNDTGGTMRAPSRTNAMIPHFVSTLKRFCHRDIGTTVFQRSYHDHVIRGEKDYQKIWEYIDTNPARWEDDCFYEGPERL